jgi:hypothetical protein
MKCRVASFSVSLDGFGAGPGQDIDNPLGIGGMELHQWVFPTRTFQRMHDGEAEGTDVLLGRGEPLFEGVDMRALGYRCVEHVPSELATHIVLLRGENVGGGKADDQ